MPRPSIERFPRSTEDTGDILLSPELMTLFFGGSDNAEISRYGLNPEMVNLWTIDLANGKLPSITDEFGNSRKAKNVAEFEAYVRTLKEQNKQKKEAKKKRQ